VELEVVVYGSTLLFLVLDRGPGVAPLGSVASFGCPRPGSRTSRVLISGVGEHEPATLAT
jgi:hypothetical protein